MKPLQLLLADDDSDDCLLFREALEELSEATYLTTVQNGEQLMNRLSSPGNLPDVLFLDLNMPRLSGFECLLEIKFNENLKHLPVIIFSTFIDPYLSDLLYENGAHYGICKPKDFEELKQVIQHSLTLIAQGNGLQPAKSHFVLSASTALSNLRA